MLSTKWFKLLLLALLGMIGTRTGRAAYTMTDLGTLGGTNTNGAGINNAGQIVGNSQDATGAYFGFVYSNGQMSSLGNFGTFTAGARNINNLGQVAGKLSNGHLFIWSNGQYTDLGIPLGGTVVKGYGFNDSGQITGQVTLTSGQIHGFLLSPSNGGTSIDIGTMGGHSTDFSYGSSVNAFGQIEGDSINANGLDHAFIWTNGTFVDLGTFGGPASSGIAINNLGHATGTAQTPASTSSDLVSHVFFYDGMTMHDLGTLGGDYANAGGMNNLDQIVGYSYMSDNVTTHAFFAANGVMTDLNTLIPSGSGWTLTNATGINDQGDIVANGVNSSGVENTFLLTPGAVPEPTTLSILAPSLLLLVRRNSRRRRRRT